MKETCKDKNKEDNRAGNNEDTLGYISCDSKKHFLPRCPHSWENMVNITESGSSNEEDNMFSKATIIDGTLFFSSIEERTSLEI